MLHYDKKKVIRKIWIADFDKKKTKSCFLLNCYVMPSLRLYYIKHFKSHAFAILLWQNMKSTPYDFLNMYISILTHTHGHFVVSNLSSSGETSCSGGTAGEWSEWSVYVNTAG